MPNLDFHLKIHSCKYAHLQQAGRLQSEANFKQREQWKLKSWLTPRCYCCPCFPLCTAAPLLFHFLIASMNYRCIMTAKCFSVCRAHAYAGPGSSAALEQRVLFPFNFFFFRQQVGKHGQSSSVKLFCNRAVMLSELRVWAEATVAAKLRVKFLNVCFKHKSDSISSRQKPYPLQTHAGPGLIHVSFNPRSKASRISMPEGRNHYRGL